MDRRPSLEGIPTRGSLVPALWATHITFVVLAALSVALRLYARRLTRQKILADDYHIVLSLVWRLLPKPSFRHRTDGSLAYLDHLCCAQSQQ